MIGSVYKKFAKQHNMTVAHGVAYGNFYGYASTLCEGAGWKAIVISTRFQDLEKRDAFRKELAQQNLTSQYRVRSLEIVENGIHIIFTDNPGTMKKIDAFCQWFMPQLASYGASGVEICSECGTPIFEDGCWKLLSPAALHIHQPCAQKLQQQMEADEVQLQQERTGSYSAGFTGALIGAILGAVVWGLVLHLGFMASVIGFLIGFLAEKGYTLLKGKQGKGKRYILAGATIFGVLLGNFGYDAVMWAKQISLYAPDAVAILNGVEVPVSYGDIPMLISYFLANDPAYRSGMVMNCLMGIGFAMLGVWTILRKAKRETTAPKLINLK